MAEWGYVRMEEWGNVRMSKWGNVGMAEWGNVGMGHVTGCVRELRKFWMTARGSALALDVALSLYMQYNIITVSIHFAFIYNG